MLLARHPNREQPFDYDPSTLNFSPCMILSSPVIATTTTANAFGPPRSDGSNGWMERISTLYLSPNPVDIHLDRWLLRIRYVK